MIFSFGHPFTEMRNMSMRIGMVVLGMSGLVGAATRPAVPPVGSGVEAIITIDSVGSRGVMLGAIDNDARVLVYADGPARVGVGVAPLADLQDTLRLDRMSALTVDVTESDVHVELVGEQLPATATIAIGGSVTGGPASRVSATGRHLLLLKGGQGIRLLAPAVAR